MIPPPPHRSHVETDDEDEEEEEKEEEEEEDSAASFSGGKSGRGSLSTNDSSGGPAGAGHSHDRDHDHGYGHGNGYAADAHNHGVDGHGYAADAHNHGVDGHGHGPELQQSGDIHVNMQTQNTTPNQSYDAGQQVLYGDPCHHLHPHSHHHSLSHDIGDISADDQRILLAITVEIDEHKIESIVVRDGDCAEDLASKFCKEHSIPDRYVFPLTEHIIDKLQNVSRVDDAVMEDSTIRDGATENVELINSIDTPERHNQTHSLFEKTKPELCAHRLCSLKSLAHKEIPKVKTRKPTGHYMSPSFASLGKFQKITEKKTEQQRSPQLSPKLKAVYTRLYVEFLHHKKRMEEEKRASLAQYQERLERDKPSYTKKTRRLMLLRGRAAKQFKNYGELLYQEALKKDAEKKKIAEQRHLEEQSNLLKGITAKPEISKYAQQLKRPEKFWERLSADKSKSNLRELQHESMEMKLMECTFRPRINKKYFGEEDMGNSNRFDQLFWDAENRRRRQAEYKHWHPEGATFQPVINPHWNSSSIYGHNDDSNRSNVFDRLLQYAAKLAEKKQRRQNEMKLVDPMTGQELFHPQTGRKPHGERKTDAIPIGDFLYQLKFSLDNKKKTLMERNIQKAKELANGQYVNLMSCKLLQSRRMRSAQEIFDLLDTDKDGLLDLTNIDWKNLPGNVVDDLNEVRKIGSAFERDLPLDKFTKLLMDVQKRRGGSHFLSVKSLKRQSEPENNPFKFKVDHHSCRLASGRRKPGNTRHWYRLVLSDKERKQAKLDALRKEKESQELSECTFRPSLHKKDFIGSARCMHRSPVNARLSPQSTAVDKEQQEIHGFIFGEVNADASGQSESAAAKN